MAAGLFWDSSTDSWWGYPSLNYTATACTTNTVTIVNTAISERESSDLRSEARRWLDERVEEVRVLAWE